MTRLLASWLALFVLVGCPGDAPGVRGDGLMSLLDGSPPQRDGAADVDQQAPPKQDHGLTPSDKGTPPPVDKGTIPGVVPPLGGASGGSGGAAAPSGAQVTSGGVSFILIVPSIYLPTKPNRALIIFSGTEGASVMAQNMLSVGASTGLGDVIIAVLDGKTYFGNGQAGAAALDYLRAKYNVDNDRTYLLSESAGTSAGQQLGLSLRQSFFAAYWANDVNATATPAKTAAQLGFAPWGNAGPGGQLAAATAIVSGMQAAGYRLPADAPYSGAGSTQHGSTAQFLEALKFFAGKSRK